MGMTISEQAVDFLLACLLGAGLGVLYDVFRIIRLAFWHGKIVVAVQDILFWILAAISTFLFMIMHTEGQIRFYVLLGELLGFTVYYFTIGMLVIHMSRWIISLIKKVFMTLYKIFIRPFVKLFVFIFQKFRVLFVRVVVKLKKVKRNAKFRLPKKDVLLYNQNSSIIQTAKVKQNAKKQKKIKKKRRKKQDGKS